MNAPAIQAEPITKGLNLLKKSQSNVYLMFSVVDLPINENVTGTSAGHCAPKLKYDLLISRFCIALGVSDLTVTAVSVGAMASVFAHVIALHTMAAQPQKAGNSKGLGLAVASAVAAVFAATASRVACCNAAAAAEAAALVWSAGLAAAAAVAARAFALA